MQLDPAGHHEPSRAAPRLGPPLEEGPPILDPYAGVDDASAPTPEASGASTWAFWLGISSIVLGPLTALAGLVLGILGRRAARRMPAGPLADRALRRAHVGVVAGGLWIAGAAMLPPAYWLYGRVTHEGARGTRATGVQPPATRLKAITPPRRFDPSGTVPYDTEDRLVGQVHVVTLGVGEATLAEALRREIDKAKADGTEVLVTTTRSGCEPCDGLQSSIPHALMQAVFRETRLVVVDIDVFERDLDALGIDHEVLPGYFLLGPDLAPRDAIHGGEWGEDIAANIAPVLGPFLRGELEHRKYDYRVAHRFPPSELIAPSPRRRPGPSSPPPPATTAPPPSGVWL